MTVRDSERVLILAPHGRDADVASLILEQAGISSTPCPDVEALCREILGAGAALIAAEALPPRAARQLAEALDRQPSWSELPLLIFALPGPERLVPTFAGLEERHFTILDRPIGVKALVTATRTALRWRKRQYEVRNLMMALENRVHERDKFLAILGHELRNPLGAILLASQMIDQSDHRLDSDHAALIERQARHLTRLVDDLLDLSRVTAGKIVLQRRSVDLYEIVLQTLRTLEETAPIRGLTINTPAPAERVSINGDPVRIEQIVSNLVTNAIKYTPAGGTIDITVSSSEGSGILRVRDTGVGIARERLNQIFGLFTQAENAIGRAQGGMGIGLSLVRNLVELHGGSVEAKSDGVGKGSEFVVQMPLASSAHPVTPDTSSLSRPAQMTASRRVVIVEDNADIRTLLQLKLRRLGHDVEAVGDGERGIERIEHLKPDLALVDIGLPGLDGYEVAQQVRTRLGDAIFLVALSGFGQPEDKRRAIEAGFNEHMTKPADVKDLEELLSRVPSASEAGG